MKGINRIMKLGIFTDSHFSSAEITCCNRHNNESFRKIKQAYEYFNDEKCDMVICLGDLIDKEDNHIKEIDNLKKLSEIMLSYEFKSYVILGNHDAFEFDADEFYSIIGEQFRPKNVHTDGKNLVFLDACYFKSGMHYKRGDSDWTDTYYPMTDELEILLAGISGDVYIFMHQNVDQLIRDDHRVSNADELRSIFANSKKVRAVYQGHYHPGFSSECDGIRYVTYPAMCENEDAYYIIEI